MCLKKLKFLFDTDENIVEKGENVFLPAFSPFPTMFSNAFFVQGCLKSRLCGKELNFLEITTKGSL